MSTQHIYIYIYTYDGIQYSTWYGIPYQSIVQSSLVESSPVHYILCTMYCMPYTIYYMTHILYQILHIRCYMLYAICYMLYTICSTGNFCTKNCPTKNHWGKISWGFPRNWGLSPLKNKSLAESNLLKRNS